MNPISVKPYYQAGNATIYHGDCRAIMPEMVTDSVDLIVADPPYDGLKGGVEFATSAKSVADVKQRSVTVGSPWLSDLDWVHEAWRIARLGMMVFCSHHNAPEVASMLPRESRVALVTWYKRNAPPCVANVPRFMTEFIWLFKKRPGLDWKALPSTMLDVPNANPGCMTTERFVDGSGKAVHPCQKPLSVLLFLLAVGGESILDPFMGTGTALRAAKDLRRGAIGIETEQRYCDLAVSRLSQEVLL